MDGIEAMRLIREKNPALPIILSSGYTEDYLTFTEAPGEKTDAFLKKPLQLIDMENTLEKLLFW